MSFESLGLSADIVRAVTERGYSTPTPIQAQAIPAVLAGGDLLAGAQTGTGKTAGFTLPILQRLSTTRPAAQAAATPGARPGKSPVRALVLVPTRELAAQVEESVRDYGKYVKIESMVMFGGVGVQPQIDRLKRRVDILVATPGRLLDHVGQRTVDLSQVEILVLDEADRMLDMGFIHDIKKVLALLPKKRQNLLFSATFSDEIKELADRLLDNPALIEVARRNATADRIEQRVVLVDRDKKRQVLAHLVKSGDWKQVLVFMRTKHGCNRLAEQLNDDGITAMAIHGNKSQGARTRALSEFKDGTLRVLVATDIAARGIDINELPHVVNYELPNVSEDYVHRIGRTGRAGADGEAVSLVCVDELQFLSDIERLIKRQLPRETVPGFAYDPTVTPEPIVLGRRQVLGQRGGRRPAGGTPSRGASSAPRGGGAATQRRPDGRGDGHAAGRASAGPKTNGNAAGAGNGAARGGPGQPGGRSANGGGRGASNAGAGRPAGGGRSTQDGRRGAPQDGRRNGGAQDGAAPRGQGGAAGSGTARPASQPAAQPAAQPASRGVLSGLAALFRK